MKKIGLSLSGGGIRAIVFHLGVLQSLAKKGLFEKVSFISSVSGGSLCLGLIYSLSKNQWPSSDYFLKSILPNIKEILTSIDIQKKFKMRIFLSPWNIIRGKANILGEIIEKEWGILSDLSEIPDEPRWIINATCFETGKNWRFMSKRMGDYLSNYVLRPKFKLSYAIASSSAILGLIGTLKIKTEDYIWKRFISQTQTEIVKPQFKVFHLWDGGVYENLGVESLFKNNKINRKEFDYLIVSDASASLKQVKKPSYSSLKSVIRLLDITTDQMRALRSRSLIDYFKTNVSKGILLRIGNTCKYILDQANANAKNFYLTKTLSKDEVLKLANMETSLKKLNHKEYELLERHGYEVCEATSYAYSGSIK